MGCHTWCYRKIELSPDSLDEWKTRVRKILDTSLTLNVQDWCKTNFDIDLNSSEYSEELGDIKEDFKWFQSRADDDDFMIRIYEGDLKALSEISESIKLHPEDPEEEYWNYIFKITPQGDVYLYDNDNILSFAPFRVLDYPEGFWTDSKSLIEFLETSYKDSLYDQNKNKIEFINNKLPKEIIEWIENFFNNNPGGVGIDFG